jgi:hypothetical protein
MCFDRDEERKRKQKREGEPKSLEKRGKDVDVGYSCMQD